MDWIFELKKIMRGDVVTSGPLIEEYSKDTSIFKLTPQVVVLPKDVKDVKTLVAFVASKQREIPDLSLTARSAGTDMTGGPLSESIVVGFTKYFNHFSIEGNHALVEPGVYYRDFEKETLARGLLLPSYPASKGIAAMGGMISNDAAGEKTLRYGKTGEYIDELSMVLADGNEYTFGPLSKEELEAKKRQDNFEGKIYRELHSLLELHYDVIQKARPHVTKNSSGYNLWDVWDRNTFNLAKLFVGAQGTLGLMSRARVHLVPVKVHTRLAVLFLKDLGQLPELVEKILPLTPESLEIFDNETLKLALRFMPEIARRAGNQNFFSFAIQFMPEFLIGVKLMGLPKLVVLAEFAESEEGAVEEKFKKLDSLLRPLPVYYRLIHDAHDAEKYWIMRRESFNLLRQHVTGKRTVPFVDDVTVEPKYLPEFIPKLYAIMREHNIYVTLAGHAGNGNLHIIPLMDLSKKEEREKISIVAKKVYDLVLSYGGSISAEHNDGLIRGPYVKEMFGEKMYRLFQEVEHILDPSDIFNPGKKINVDFAKALAHINPQA